VTGVNTLHFVQRNGDILEQVAAVIGTKTDDAVAGVQRKLDELKAAQDELKVMRARLASGRAVELAADAVNGIVVARVDGITANDLRDLAVAVRQQSGISAVVLGGVTDTGGVSIVGATATALKANAGDLIKDAAKAVGGGGGGKGDIATAGGKNSEALDEALAIAREKAAAIIGSLG
jgi:alanyl-tRNA synthetase